MLLEEIIDKINGVKVGLSSYLSDVDAYAICAEGYRGIAIKTENNVFVDEAFNNVFLKTFEMKINKEKNNYIFLFTKNEFLGQQYASLCLDFVDLNKREINMKNPIIWFNEWKDLIGNSIKNKLIYDVIGEMKLLVELYKKCKKPVWNSIERGTYDITCDDCVIEVKTTKSKTKELLTVHNQFQLDTSGLNKPLYIGYCKLEKNEAGESIDTLYNELVSLGHNKNDLDLYLKKLGYYQGKEERYIKYTINEIRFYKVDDNFPKITKNDFINGKMPSFVVNFQYTISLDGLEFLTLDQI